MKLLLFIILAGSSLKFTRSEVNLHRLKSLVNLNVDHDFVLNTSDVKVIGRAANYDDKKCQKQIDYLQEQLQVREMWAMKS